MKYLVSPITTQVDYAPSATFIAPWTQDDWDRLVARMNKAKLLEDFDESFFRVDHWSYFNSIWGIPKGEGSRRIMEKHFTPYMYDSPGIVELPDDFISQKITWERRKVDCKISCCGPDTVRQKAYMGDLKIESYSFTRDFIESNKP